VGNDVSHGWGWLEGRLKQSRWWNWRGEAMEASGAG